MLTCTRTITAIRAQDGEHHGDVELACTRQTGGTHLTGWATFVAPA